jgi:tRNA(Arg) A34 adenosine deaminase TadA/glycerol-3-phosphate cytidylyltransferase-like family protein
MRKIISFGQIRKILRPNTVTIVSGSFEPFDEYYFRLLQWGAKQGRPFVVIIQKDDMVLKRKGFKSLSSTHKTRAEIISSLEFVDYVVIENRTAHDRECIEVIKPKTIVFQRDNIEYRRILAREIKKEYPEIRIAQVPFDRRVIVVKTSFTYFGKMTTLISRALIKHSALSRGKSSKISALLADKNNKILLIEQNNEVEEHAEVLLLKKAKERGLHIAECIMYVLIPPCRMCAEIIARSPIKEVRYLVPYGDNSGLHYLREKGVQSELFQRD